jgi:hypothetical protein
MVPLTEGSPSPPSVPARGNGRPRTRPAPNETGHRWWGAKALRSYPPHTENEPECPVITLW